MGWLQDALLWVARWTIGGGVLWVLAYVVGWMVGLLVDWMASAFSAVAPGLYGWVNYGQGLIDIYWSDFSGFMNVFCYWDAVAGALVLLIYVWLGALGWRLTWWIVHKFWGSTG